jgi:hypothetical protein
MNDEFGSVCAIDVGISDSTCATINRRTILGEEPGCVHELPGCTSLQP